jgi:hypothetical protein
MKSLKKREKNNENHFAMAKTALFSSMLSLFCCLFSGVSRTTVCMHGWGVRFSNILFMQHSYIIAFIYPNNVDEKSTVNCRSFNELLSAKACPQTNRIITGVFYFDVLKIFKKNNIFY